MNDINDSSLVNLRSDCFKALRCLHIAVDPSVADDVSLKVKSYVSELERRCGLDFNDQSAAIEAEVASYSLPPELVAAMTIWGESRGETLYGQRCVAGVIYNRAIRRASKTGYPLSLSVSEVCLAPHQFSCWQDGEFVQKQPDETSSVWSTCADVAGEIFEDGYRPPFMATHYYAPAKLDHAPEWASKMKFVCKVGGHAFYLEEGWRGVS